MCTGDRTRESINDLTHDVLEFCRLRVLHSTVQDSSMFFISQPRIIFKMIKSTFQNPNHVAIRILVYAPPRCFSAEISGADGAASATVAKSMKEKFGVFHTLAPKLSRIRALYGQTV